MLGPLSMFYVRTANFKAALNYANRCSAVARAVDDETAIELARPVLGTSLHLTGDLGSARAELEAALPRGPRAQPRTTAIHLGFEGKYLAGAILARTLWLQGHPAQAVERARQTVTDAAAMDHSLTLSIALIWAISVFLWTGDSQRRRAHRSYSRVPSHPIRWHLIWRSDAHFQGSWPSAGAIPNGALKLCRAPCRSCTRLDEAADHAALHLARSRIDRTRPISTKASR